MRPAYGMGRRSFSRPGALRFTAAPCSRLAKRRAVQQGGRPAIHSSAAPPHGSRRPAAQPPLHSNPRRSAAQPPFDPTSGGQPDSATQTRFTATPGDRRRSPHFTATPRPVTKWRANRHGSHPPGHRPSAPSRITPRNRRAPPSTAVQPRFTTTPGDRRRSPHFTATRRTATQPRFTATPGDRSRNGGQTGTAATRRAAVSCALLHNPPEPPRPRRPLA